MTTKNNNLIATSGWARFLLGVLVIVAGAGVAWGVMASRTSTLEFIVAGQKDSIGQMRKDINQMSGDVHEIKGLIRGFLEARKPKSPERSTRHASEQ